MVPPTHRGEPDPSRGKCRAIRDQRSGNPEDPRMAHISWTFRCRGRQNIGEICLILWCCSPDSLWIPERLPTSSSLSLKRCQKYDVAQKLDSGPACPKALNLNLRMVERPGLGKLPARAQDVLPDWIENCVFCNCFCSRGGGARRNRSHSELDGPPIEVGPTGMCNLSGGARSSRLAESVRNA